MEAKELLREIIESTPGWSQNKVAKSLNITSQTMSNRMNANDLKIGFVAAVLEKLSYELVVLPPETDLPRGAKVISPNLEASQRSDDNPRYNRK